MTNEEPYSNEQVTCFVGPLKNELPEHRDNRAKRHPLAFVMTAFVLATRVGRQKHPSIHRFMRNRADWLHELAQTPKVKPISRAHLPRLLDGLNGSALNELIERCLGVRIQSHETLKWVAIDGKALRGTLDAGDKQNLILAVERVSREVVAQARQCGDKSSEIPVVRELFERYWQLFMDSPEQFMMDALASITGYRGELGENAEAVLISSYYALADLFGLLLAQPASTLQAMYRKTLSALLDVYFEVISSLMVMV